MSNNNASNRDPELLSAYMDGELSGEELRAVEQWLATDPAAQAQLEEMQSVSATLQALPRESLSDERKQAIADQVHRIDDSDAGASGSDGVPAVRIGRSTRGWLYSAAAIAAAIAIMLSVSGDVDDEVAMNKRAADAGELEEAIVEADADPPELRGMPAPHDLPESGSGPAAEESLAEATATDNSRTLAAAAGEAVDLDSSTEMLADESSARIASAPRSEILAPAFDRIDMSSMQPSKGADTGDLSTDSYFIVWADVPPVALRNQQINLVLGNNGIQIDEQRREEVAAVRLRDSERGDDTSVEAVPLAAEPMLEQIAVRNFLHNAQQIPGGENQAGGAFGFGGGFGGVASGREARSSGLTDGEVDSEDGDREGDVVEGETILVEATAEQIASCLVDMEQDTDNFHTITLEPVQQRQQLQQLAARVDPAQQRELVEADAYLSRIYQEQSLDSRDPRNNAEAKSQSRAQSRLESSNRGQKKRAVKQMAEKLDAQAQRVERPQRWYYYNAPPRDQQFAYQLRGGQAQSKSKIQIARGASEMQQQLAELNVRKLEEAPSERLQPAGTDGLPDSLPLQVLFVLRSTELASPETASE